ncbi:hypothetical protein [Pontiella sulfatireligans]|uniref:Uncharacterized protein n=1 Tax=Pontiella sulfatireligans TaxID=2750658 RepID=A0A6C2UVQ2_9BACT|nr:hypothetical protein [Pontiella sulfatireligans]VGO23187.1 hypothetical protein SCARR_05292 [Pontiella sulfatireligans]
MKTTMTKIEHARARSLLGRELAALAFGAGWSLKDCEALASKLNKLPRFEARVLKDKLSEAFKAMERAV